MLIQRLKNSGEHHTQYEGALWGQNSKPCSIAQEALTKKNACQQTRVSRDHAEMVDSDEQIH